MFGEGCLKEHADAVKKAGSLTSMHPSVVKSLEAVAKEPTAAAVAVAKTALSKQVTDLEKESAKAMENDKVLSKKFKIFAATLGDIEAKLKLQTTVG